ncbi:hypothetical protein [Desulfonatronovibrio magnus]|uniref:hypothetical protein n=1 Tax=Desulfonatronovibrio magnus TaxID=698827 RepID=UPI0005EB7B84|nr:hypothetical protein [Desulfonatronovibrio magnus]
MNTLKITPNMSVQQISQLALELGCEVIIGNTRREISLKHPEIKSSLALSDDQQNLGNKFVLWAKPLIKNNKKISTMLNLESQQGQIARLVQKRSAHDAPVLLDDLAAELESTLTKKQVADGVSQLSRKGYVERLEQGKYTTTEILNLAVEAYNANEGQMVEPSQENQEAPLKKITKSEEVDAKVDLIKLQGLIQRLDGVVEKLEAATQKLQDHEEIQDALDVMGKALAKIKAR